MKDREELLAQLKFVAGHGNSCVLVHRETKTKYILSVDGYWTTVPSEGVGVTYRYDKKVVAWRSDRETRPEGVEIKDKQWIAILILAAFPHWIPNLS